MFAFAAGKIIRAAIFTAISAALFPQPNNLQNKLKGQFVRTALYCCVVWFYVCKTDFGDKPQLLTSIKSVPQTIRAKPSAAFFVNFSLKTIAENAIETRMLSLSIGTTTVASPP